ncbi:hypothetical protein C7I87_21160 [Mesorhizobium sp. SARCC-RB16n]|nr:hypothetical protein C7I87_21160 [Mesorhizobium sp. SARCC-RB16n]
MVLHRSCDGHSEAWRLFHRNRRQRTSVCYSSWFRRRSCDDQRCQHRSMLLLEGHGNVKRIRCPLHSWVYDLEGHLLSAPALNDVEDFDKNRVCLPRIRSEVW